MSNADKSNSDIQARPYQLQLVEHIVRRNAIVYLPTGAGKTFVAILALKRFMHHLQETIENGGKRAVFMCNTVELARQQALCLKKCTNLKIGFYVGERDVDNWHRNKWAQEINDNQVLVGTAQIFLEIVTQKFITINDFAVVIIDECHHGSGHHPMHEFMRLFQLANQNNLPRVIGLTGILLKGNESNNITKRLTELETIYRGNIITVNDMEQFQNVMIYSAQPNETLVCFDSSFHVSEVQDKIVRVIETLCKSIEEYSVGNILPKMSKGLANFRQPSKKGFLISILKDFLFQLNEYGIYAGSIAIMAIIIEVEIKKRQAETLALRILYRTVIAECECVRHMLVRKLCDLKDDEHKVDNVCYTPDIILNFSTPKLRGLLNYLRDEFSNKKREDICCLIFVERRYTAKCVYGVISKFVETKPELKGVIIPQFIVGRNSVAQDVEGILDRKWNKSAIQQFRDKECNVIICSNVLEEGIDVQACNYVIAFDPLKTFGSYVQTKGRARCKESTYTMFTPRINREKFVAQIMKYRHIHNVVRDYLVGRVLTDEEPDTTKIEEHFQETIQPFVIPSGAILLPSIALSLLHRYCQTLPADAFGIVLPWFRLLTQDEVEKKLGSKELRTKSVVELTLPLTSKVKESIYSEPMRSSRMAKLSAAFNACIKLYECGELNDKLIPITIRECVAKIADKHFEHWKKYGDDVTQKETKQQIRKHKKKCPEQLYNAHPKVNESCYCYEIKLTPQFEANDYNEHIHKRLLASSNFGILTRNRLPPLAVMPLFMKQGIIHVEIVDEPIIFMINSETKMKKIRMFHLMIFRDLLNLWHPFFVLDNRSKENSILIVPLINRNIDMDLIMAFQRLSPPRAISLVERKAKEVRPQDYLDKVVTQWYSSADYKRFIVTKIRNDMTPSSIMDRDVSYADYTLSKYGHATNGIAHPDQFLIEVRELTSRLNYFGNAAGKNTTINKDRQKVILIPELCYNFMFPGEMWLKALFLPSILHRVHFMLHADNLRLRINEFLGLNRMAINSSGYRPKALQMDRSLRRIYDIDGNAVNQDEVDEKIVLNPLPTKKFVSNPKKSLVLGMEKVTWNDYMEPEDFDRRQLTLYPVEIEYYYKFVSGMNANIDALKSEDEKLWTQSQLDMPEKCIYNMSTPTQENQCAVTQRPAIADTSPSSKSQISILERSLKHNVEITPAEQSEFLAALTTASAGDVFDMERFEVLGDSFLKFSSTLYLATKYPNWNEGVLTEIKSKLVSNRNLLYCLMETDIPQLICKTELKPKYTWLPPNASLPYNVLDLWDSHPELAKCIGTHNIQDLILTENEIVDGLCAPFRFDEFLSDCKKNSHLSTSGFSFDNNEVNCFVHTETIRDKVLADTLEAVLGVCIKNYGIHNGFRMLEFFGICKPDVNKPLTNLLDLDLGSPLLRANVTYREVDGFLINHHRLEENLGYKFKDRAYLLQALTHPSYPTNRLTGCYQQLEFIGDAILDFLVTAYIFERHTHMTPGMLTDLRSALVNNTTLACICVRHRFHLFILSENSILAETIKKFADFQETQNYQVTDQVRILIDETDNALKHDYKKKPYNMSVNVDVPKALGDILEALIAAVYLDCRDLLVTWNVIYKMLEPEIIAFSQNVPINPIRQLIEHKYAKPKFSAAVVERDVVMIKCEFFCLDKTIEVYGFGRNAQQAKLSAAKHALQKLCKNSTN